MITQGNWEVSKHATPDYAPQYGIYADGERNDLCTVKGENAEDNARLIAAAPELLAACKDGEKFLDCLLAGNGMSETQLRMMSENRMAFRRVLDEAIAKAEKT